MEENRINEFIVSFEQLIAKNQSEEALNEVLDPNNEEILRFAALDLLIPVGNRLADGRLFRQDIETWCTLQSVLEYLVKLSNPKEILIGLLELLEQAKSDEFFDLIIRPLKNSFLRLPTKNVDTLLWALNGLYKYVSKINLPDYEQNFDDQGEKSVLENCPTLIRVDMCVNSTLNFVEPFVSEAKECKLIESSAQRNRQVLALASFLMKFLEKPVSSYDIRKDRLKSNEDRYETTERLISMIFDLTPNVFWKIISWYRCNKLTMMCKFLEPNEQEKCRVPSSSVLVLATFVHCHGFCCRHLPCVYSHAYVFQSLLPYAVEMFRSNFVENYVRFSLKLLKYFVQFFDESSWTPDRLDDRDHQDLFLGLVNAMTYCRSKKIRRKSFLLFNNYLNLLTDDGKLLVIRMIYHYVGEDSQANDRWCIAGNGIRGYMIDYYRGKLREEIACRSAGSGKTAFESSLCSMVGIFSVLKHREETDLLEYFDQYMAVLNLLRYVCLTWAAGLLHLRINFLLKIKENFLDVLTRAVELSKAHYELDLANVFKEEGSKKSAAREQITVLQQAINSFDLLSSLVGRVIELMAPILGEK